MARSSMTIATRSKRSFELFEMNRVLRTVPRFTSAYANKSGLMSRSLSTRFGYECNSLSNLDYDVTFLEKSVRAGTRVIMTKSGHCEAAIDVLLDLSEFDGIDFQDVTMGHVCKLPKVSFRNEKIASSSEHMKAWTDELTRMHKVLHRRGKALDVVFIQVPQLEHLTAEGLTSLFQAFHSYFAENSKILTKVPKLGLDFDSAFLYGLSDAQVDALIALLDSLPPSVAAAAAQVGALSVASNALTFLPAARLVQWAKSREISTFSTEVMRCHPRRPSQVATNFNHANEHKPIGEDKIFAKPKLTPEVEQSTTISRMEKQRMLDIMEAANDMTMALDRCVKVEKSLLEELHPEFKPPAVNPSSICLAHILSSNINQFLFPEEWSHIANTQYIPHLNATCGALKQAGPKLADWVSLYRSMNTYLVSSYRTLLQFKALRLSQSLHDQLLLSLPELAKFSTQDRNRLSTNSLDDMALYLSVLSALSVGADHTLVTFNKIEDERWTTALRAMSNVPQDRLVQALSLVADTLRQEWTAAEPTSAGKQLK